MKKIFSKENIRTCLSYIITYSVVSVIVELIIKNESSFTIKSSKSVMLFCFQVLFFGIFMTITINFLKKKETKKQSDKPK